MVYTEGGHYLVITHQFLIVRIARRMFLEIKNI